MSLLTPPTDSTRTKTEMDALIRGVWNDLQIRQQDGMDLFWSNPRGLTPQQVSDLYGTDAKKLFDFNTALVTFLLTIGTIAGATPNLRLPKKQFTVNPDGTVTVLEADYVP